MHFHELPIAGAWTVESDPFADDRGWFVRTSCADEFREHGLDPVIAQSNLSHSFREGTLRGLHLQTAPHEEAKLVRCVRGAVWDVLVDLRPGSSSYGKWHAVELAADDGRAVYIPRGCAHGFQSLRDDTQLLYQISTAYSPDHATGVHWADPDLAIDWPEAPAAGRTISTRDEALPSLARFAAIHRASGSMTGVYRPDELERLRQDWSD